MPETQFKGGKAFFVDWADEVPVSAYIREEFAQGPYPVEPEPHSQKRCRIDKVYWIRDKNNDLHGIPQVLLKVVQKPT